MRTSKCVMLLAAIVSLWVVAVSLAADGAKASVAENLKKVGNALAIYAAEFNDRLPPNLGMTMNGVAGTPAEVLQVYAPTAVVPEEITKASQAKQIEWINQNSSFQLMIPFGQRFTMRNASTTPLAVEKPSAEPNREKLSVLYGDFHVEDRPRAEVEAMLAPATGPATQK